MNNADISEKLRQMAAMSEYSGESPFRVSAFLKASESVAAMEEQASEMIRRSGSVAEVPGIGKGISAVIADLVNKGSSSAYDELRKKTPSGFFEMLSLPGIGVKKLRALCQALGCDTIDELEAAASSGKVALVKGFSAASERSIVEGAAFRRATRNSLVYVMAEQVFAEIGASLKSSGKLAEVRPAGGLARGLPVVSNLSFLCRVAPGIDPVEGFSAAADASGMQGQLAAVCDGLAAGTFRHAPRGVTCDAFVASSGFKGFEGLALALSYSDGYLAKCFESSGTAGAPSDVRERLSLALSAARAIERSPGLAIVPEHSEVAYLGGRVTRHGSGGLFAARDVRGVVHVHTSYSDGAATLAEMAACCRRLGYGYVGITDHSKSAFYANGLDVSRLSRFIDEADSLNEKCKDFRIFKGIECDILKDGSLDYPDSVLERLDFVIASIHSSFRMPAAEMTRRIVEAVTNPRVTMLGHMTGRLLLERRGYDLDVDAVFEAAARSGTIIELNCNPFRMDVDYTLLPRMREMRIMTSVNPDAHSPADVGFISRGVAALNLGGITPGDRMVFNQLDASGVSGYLESRKKLF